MKWVFLVFLIGFTPVLLAWLRNNPEKLPQLMFVFGTLPFLEYMLNISASPYGWPMWRGYAVGIEISLTDAFALAILFGTKARSKIQIPTLAKIAFGIYLLAFFITYVMSEVPIASGFYGWQILRTFLIFLAVARAVSINEKAAPALFAGLAAGVIVQAVDAVTQFAGGATQAGGIFGHQNTLGMITNFIAIPAFALFLGGYQQRLAIVCILAALVIAYTGGSRATIGLLMVGMGVTLMLSIWHHRTGRKAAIGGGAVIGALLLSTVMIAAVDRRSEADRESSNEMRDQMIEGAKMIIADHPFGIGANMYVTTANTGGYVARSGVTWTSAQAIIHNTYYLVRIELGPLGLVGLILLILSAILGAIRNVKRLRPSLESEYSVGTAAALLAFSVHAYFEWVPMIFAVHTLFAITFGLVIGFWARKGVAGVDAFRRKPISRKPGRGPVANKPRLARR